MGHNDGSVSGKSGSSAVSGSKALEAQLVSQATLTATAAARSILMSGGSEEVALKTAKAAAESVLTPNPSDTETIGGRSTTFLRRRKVKRQAEVVASMALMQAASSNNRSVRSGGGSAEWETRSNSTRGNLHAPYPRHFTTRSMNTQDEPSVLSGSTRPPKAPTPRNTDNQRRTPRAMELNYHQAIEERDNNCAGSRHSRDSSTLSNALRFPTPSSNRQVQSSQRENYHHQDHPGNYHHQDQPGNYHHQDHHHHDHHHQDHHHQDQPGNYHPDHPGNYQDHHASPPHQQDRAPNYQEHASKYQDARSRRTVPAQPVQQPTNDQKKNRLNAKALAEHEAVNQMGTLDYSADQAEEDEDTVGDTTTGGESTRKKKEKVDSTVWTVLGGVLSTTLNILTCGPLSTFVANSNDSSPKAENSVNSPISEKDLDGSTFGGFSETDLDDRDDTTTNLRDLDSEDHSDNDTDRFLSGSASSSSSDDSSHIHNLKSSESSEGEIKVRSSIRQTMEKIVSNNKRGMREGVNDNAWLSYELREQDENRGPEMSANANSIKDKQRTASQRKFFFTKSRSKVRKQGNATQHNY